MSGTGKSTLAARIAFAANYDSYLISAAAAAKAPRDVRRQFAKKLRKAKAAQAKAKNRGAK